ncbi:MAG: ATP-binding cassette domain-containing protein [Clostridia bacterium]|nr:ATP-binding cassette domain-containing protein [Clostridia bacterium]
MFYLGTIGNHPESIFYTKEDKETAKNTMEKLGIYEIRKKCFADLSGGQQQRVLVARSLCATKNIIILDEPTNGLDPMIAKQIYELLRDLREKDNIAILMVSHDIDRALKYADNVIELRNGEIKKICKPHDFIFGGDE